MAKRRRRVKAREQRPSRPARKRTTKKSASKEPAKFKLPSGPLKGKSRRPTESFWDLDRDGISYSLLTFWLSSCVHDGS